MAPALALDAVFASEAELCAAAAEIVPLSVVSHINNAGGISLGISSKYYCRTDYHCRARVRAVNRRGDPADQWCVCRHV